MWSQRGIPTWTRLYEDCVTVGMWEDDWCVWLTRGYNGHVCIDGQA